MKWVSIGFGVYTPPSISLISIEYARTDVHEISITILNLCMAIHWDRKVKLVTAEIVGGKE